MEHNETPIVNKDYLLEKMPGKSGWIYAAIPEIQQDKHAWFGWVKVRGSIDSYEISNYHLMPMGNGTLILPVKTEIRKAIGKSVGDTVHVVLFSQDLPPVLEDDFMTCLKDEPVAFEKFNQLSAKEQKTLKDWIYTVKNDNLRVERIAAVIEKLLNNSAI